MKNNRRERVECFREATLNLIHGFRSEMGEMLVSERDSFFVDSTCHLWYAAIVRRDPVPLTRSQRFRRRLTWPRWRAPLETPSACLLVKTHDLEAGCGYRRTDDGRGLSWVIPDTEGELLQVTARFRHPCLELLVHGSLGPLAEKLGYQAVNLIYEEGGDFCPAPHLLGK